MNEMNSTQISKMNALFTQEVSRIDWYQRSCYYVRYSIKDFDPSDDFSYIDSIMDKKYKDIIFYLTEGVKYYINVRNRVSGLDSERIREYDKRNMEEYGVVDYLKILRLLPTIKMIAGEIDFEGDVNRKFGIVIPRWIEILEDMINEVKVCFEIKDKPLLLFSIGSVFPKTCKYITLLTQSYGVSVFSVNNETEKIPILYKIDRYSTAG
uniref:Uncharacterized protein n=1 Tax=Meloidogyne enterolobii TaxID=390850 RepID=A0A6V7W2M6_MELEN|nr:unnamed protein product [Meloidogyne enterolobii]